MIEKFDKAHLYLCKIEDLIRLCQFLGIHESSDLKRSSLINWLIFEGYVDVSPPGWS